jgi:hypothetical protein
MAVMKKMIIEIQPGTVAELSPDDFAVVIKANGDTVQYVPGDPKIQERGVTLKATAGMASVASLLSSLVSSLLQSANRNEEDSDG